MSETFFQGAKIFLGGLRHPCALMVTGLLVLRRVDKPQSASQRKEIWVWWLQQREWQNLS